MHAYITEHFITLQTEYVVISVRYIGNIKYSNNALHLDSLWSAFSIDC